MKKAFTLAEVLITLGIIGVVAAITIPTLIQNHRKHEVETKLKRVYSIMNQAIKLSEVEYGEVTGWDDWGSATNTDEAIELFNKYIGKHIDIIDIKHITNENGSKTIRVYFKDGSILQSGNFIDYGYFINVNSITNSKSGINTFSFRFSPINKKANNKTHYGKGFEPYSYAWSGNSADLYSMEYSGNSSSLYGCATQGTYCAKLIQINGWKVPKDYPYKF